MIDDPTIVDFVQRRARDNGIVHVHPMAALTKGLKGQEMTEIGLLKAAGADGWWFEQGQFALVLLGSVLFWVAWWHDDNGRHRRALDFAVPGDVLSVWVTSVHPAL